jgi:hypothetical protein
MALDMLQLLGAAFQFVGALLTSNMLLGGLKPKQLASVLSSSIYRGKRAKGVAAFSNIRDETERNKAITLQGIAFIVLGFLLTMAAEILKLVVFVVTDT